MNGKDLRGDLGTLVRTKSLPINSGSSCWTQTNILYIYFFLKKKRAKVIITILCRSFCTNTSTSLSCPKSMAHSSPPKRHMKWTRQDLALVKIYHNLPWSYPIPSFKKGSPPNSQPFQLDFNIPFEGSITIHGHVKPVIWNNRTRCISLVHVSPTWRIDCDWSTDGSCASGSWLTRIGKSATLHIEIV